MSSARTVGNACWLTSMMSPSSLPPSVCCILSVVSSTTLLVTLACASMLTRPPSEEALALPRMACGSSRRLPVCGSGTLPWSLHHVAYSRSVLLSVSRGSSPSTCKLSRTGTKLSSRRCPGSVTHRSLDCCFSTQLPPAHSLPCALFHLV